MKKLLFALVLVATSAYGQFNVGVGFSYGSAQQPNTTDQALPAVRTEVSLTAASANGQLDSIHVYWTKVDCVDAFKVKFFHRRGDTLVLYDERGPYASYQNDASTLFVPPISIQQGDLIGVARLNGCGEPGLYAYPPFPYGSTGRHLVFAGDVSGNVNVSNAVVSNNNVMVYGSGVLTAKIDHVIPVAGSVDGAFGSHFKTRVQLLNPEAYQTITGTIFFHPAGQGGSQSDPSISYSIAPGHVVTYDDVVAATGATGLGSIDFLTRFSMPVVIAKVSTDQGTGFGIDVAKTDSAMGGGAIGYMVLPPDPEKERFNVGIRTLDGDTSFRAILKTRDGTTEATVTKSYPPNFFEQLPAATLFGQPVHGDDTIEIDMIEGHAIIYGATTDNKTNDGAVSVVPVSFIPIL